MSRFYSVTLISEDLQAKTSSIYWNELLNMRPANEWKYLLEGLIADAKIPGGGKLKSAERLPALTAFFKEQGPGKTGRRIYESTFGRVLEEELFARFEDQLETGPFDVMERLAVATPKQKHLFWICQNLAHLFFPEYFPPILKAEVVLKVKSLVLPEGAIPTMKDAYEFRQLRKFASRLLRDMDADDNPWLAAYDLDTMAHQDWVGWDIDLAMMENRKKKEGELRILCDAKWVAHLVPGEEFQSAG